MNHSIGVGSNAPGVSLSNFSNYPESRLARKGKWSAEEELYTNKVIEAFNKGTLRLTGMEGTTLRTYLAKQLSCDPMRITKKYTGASCLGKRVYHENDRPDITSEMIDATMAELGELEIKFKEKLEQMRLEKRELHHLELPEHFVTSPAIEAMLLQNSNRGVQVAPAWAYGPSQAAMAMQSYFNYANSLPLTAYVAASMRVDGSGNKGIKASTASEQSGSTSSSGSGGSSSNDSITTMTRGKSSEGSDSTSDSASTTDSAENVHTHVHSQDDSHSPPAPRVDENSIGLVGHVGGGQGDMLAEIHMHRQLQLQMQLQRGGGFTFEDYEQLHKRYPLLPHGHGVGVAQMPKHFSYLENERLMHAFGAGYNHSNAIYMAQAQAQTQSHANHLAAQSQDQIQSNVLKSKSSESNVKKRSHSANISSGEAQRKKTAGQLSQEDQKAASSLLGLLASKPEVSSHYKSSTIN
jgi:hypothetical protein